MGRVSPPQGCTQGVGEPLRLGDQLPVHEPLPDQLRDDVRHLVDGVHVADVLTTRELVDVALEVLRAQLVEGVPLWARFNMLQNDSTPFVWASPLTYSPTECFTASWLSRLR